MRLESGSWPGVQTSEVFSGAFSVYVCVLCCFAGGSISKVVHLHSWPVPTGPEQEAQVPLYAHFSIGLLECPHNMVDGFPRMRDPKKHKV